MVLARRAASEAEVVHNFLREIDSERWGDAVASALAESGGSRDLVDHPNFDNDVENATRLAALAEARGRG